MILNNTEIEKRNVRIINQIKHLNECNVEEKKVNDKKRLKQTIDLIITTAVTIAAYIFMLAITDFKNDFDNVPALMITGIFMSLIYIFSILGIRLVTFQRYSNKKLYLEHNQQKINKVTECIKYSVIYLLFVCFLCSTVEITTTGVYQIILSEI